MKANIPIQTNQNLAIHVRGLTKSYGKVRALRGINLEVEPGEMFGFLGPNGAGKTTTIRCLLEMIRPDGGKASLLGIDPQKNPVAVQSLTGYLPGEMQFFGNLTAEEGGTNVPHIRVSDQLLLSGDYRHTTRLEKSYTLSDVQEDDYQDTEPALRLEAAGNWASEVQSFFQLRLRKKYTFGTFPNRPSTAESTRYH